MAIPCFYHRELIELETVIELSNSESLHLSKSRRLKPGQKVRLINGKGLIGSGTILVVKSDLVEVQLTNFVVSPVRASNITVATAIPKGDRSKVMVDMLSQLGVTRIIPIRCDYSVSRFRDRYLEKWQRIAMEACKQSQNPWLPHIEPEWEFVHLLSNLESIAAGETASIDDLEPTKLPKLIYADAAGQYCHQLTELSGDLVAMIGPEGGFSKDELKLLESLNATAITLGDNILRTEVAAITAVSQLAAIMK